MEDDKRRKDGEYLVKNPSSDGIPVIADWCGGLGIWQRAGIPLEYPSNYFIPISEVPVMKQLEENKLMKSLIKDLSISLEVLVNSSGIAYFSDLTVFTENINNQLSRSKQFLEKE